jgi:uncharacterized protein YndB with AHSA1/START domain
MPVTSVEKDTDALTLTIVGDFPVPIERLWEAYADRSQLERFWGPPGWPATFTRHDMEVGGRSDYYMTGPDGERFHGFWEVLSLDPPHGFEVRDGFANADGTPNLDMPGMRMVMTFEATDAGSRSTSVTHFDSIEQFEELAAMGMEEGATSAIEQLDLLLKDLRRYARTTTPEILSDTVVRITRFFEHPDHALWKAHTEPALISRWLRGPEGWTMPTCDFATYPSPAVRDAVLGMTDGMEASYQRLEASIVPAAP